MSPIRWLALGSLSLAVIAAILISLGGPSDKGGASASVVSAADVPVDGTAVSGAPATDTDPSSEATPGTPGTEVAPGTQIATATPAAEPTSTSDPAADSTSGDPVVTATPTAPESTPVAPIQVPPTSSEVRLRIPALNVDAAVSPLGFDGAGGFAVPNTAGGVGWYEFSAYPGAAGNAVLGGHLNWRGSRGVFDRLDELAAGDIIYVDTAAGQVTYQVVSSASLSAQTPFADILGERSGASTLTLFTCGGTFSTAAGEYDQRTVVNAVRV